MSRVCRPGISYELSALQSVQKKAVVQDLLDCNKLLYYIQQSPDGGLFYAYDVLKFEDSVILSITDTSYAADYDNSASGQPMGNRSQ